MSRSEGGSIVGFFFNDTATTEIYPLSLHDALPIYARVGRRGARRRGRPDAARRRARRRRAQALRARTRGDGALPAVGGGPRPGRTQSEPAPGKMEPEEGPWRRQPTRPGTSSPTWTASRAPGTPP